MNSKQFCDSEMELILTHVSLAMYSPIDEIKSRSRKTEHTFSRYLCFAIMKKLRGSHYSLESIGACFGRNHATVLAGLREHDNLMKWNKSYKTVYLDVINQVSPTFAKPYRVNLPLLNLIETTVMNLSKIKATLLDLQLNNITVSDELERKINELEAELKKNS